MKIGIRPAMSANLNPYAYTCEEAHKKIAYRIKCMQELFNECVLLAEVHSISLSFQLELPEEAKGGHNGDIYVSWNPSSQNC